MSQRMQISMLSLIKGLADAMDLVSPQLSDHHRRVALISSLLAAEMGISGDDRNDLIWASLLHDSGSISQSERLEALRYEVTYPCRHAEVGYSLFRSFPPLAKAAPLIRFHHLWWDFGAGGEQYGKEVPFTSHILHLADRVAVAVAQSNQILSDARVICRRVVSCAGSMFHPRVVEAFARIAQRECFWLDALSPRLARFIENGNPMQTQLDLPSLEQLAKIFCHIIDFRSPYTATHSAAVAAVAEALSLTVGFDQTDCRKMRIAGYLHDLGKLAVPNEILEKAGPLTEDEFDRVRSHTYYTCRILDDIRGFETIKEWAGFHHEHLDGSGYPFHHAAERLTAGARIMAVADTFTALTEDRPYRSGLTPGEALAILGDKAAGSQLDAGVVGMLHHSADRIGDLRLAAHRAATADYQAFRHQTESRPVSAEHRPAQMPRSRHRALSESPIA